MFQMAFERTVRHINEVKEDCKTHVSMTTGESLDAEAVVAVSSNPVSEATVTATPDGAFDASVAQSAADIAELKKQEEMAKKSQAELMKLMANQRRLQRVKEKREARIKEQLDSLKVSDAEQRFVKVQQNKATTVRPNYSLCECLLMKALTLTLGSRHHAIWNSSSRASCRTVRTHVIRQLSSSCLSSFKHFFKSLSTYIFA